MSRNTFDCPPLSRSMSPSNCAKGGCNAESFFDLKMSCTFKVFYNDPIGPKRYFLLLQWQLYGPENHLNSSNGIKNINKKWFIAPLVIIKRQMGY